MTRSFATAGRRGAGRASLCGQGGFGLPRGQGEEDRLIAEVVERLRAAMPHADEPAVR
jgi:hypothetical protein